jgi:hypothetical protein
VSEEPESPVPWVDQAQKGMLEFQDLRANTGWTEAGSSGSFGETSCCGEFTEDFEMFNLHNSICGINQ